MLRVIERIVVSRLGDLDNTVLVKALVLDGLGTAPRWLCVLARDAGGNPVSVGLSEIVRYLRSEAA